MAIVITNTRYMIIYVIVLSVIDLASAAGNDVTTRHRQQQVSGRQGKQELYCPPCQEVSCPIKRTHALKCRGGMTLGICNCCTVCAKLEDETCGGPWDYLGRCDMGLYCDTTGPVTGDRTGTPEGICRKKATVSAAAAADQWRDTGAALYLQPAKDQPANAHVQTSTCKPRCTPDFCAKRPKAMCSAAYLDTAMEVDRTCRGECQHTSCQACRTVDVTGLACGKCSQNDFTCIRQWGACMRKTLCRKDHAPCSYGPPSGYGDNSLLGIFKCVVPQCP